MFYFMKCNTVIQYLVPIVTLTLRKHAKKKTYTGVSVELNHKKYNTRHLFQESVRTNGCLQETKKDILSLLRRQGGQYMEWETLMEKGRTQNQTWYIKLF